MKKDDNSKHVDLDLDALSNVPDIPKPTRKFATKGLSVGELSELPKHNTTITEANGVHNRSYMSVS